MSTDQHNAGHGSGPPPVHGDVSFEPRDVRVSGVLKFLAFLGFALGVSYLICLGVYKLATSRAAMSDLPPPIVRQSAPAEERDEPLLQGVPGHESDAQQDLREKLAADRQALEETRWVDEKAGVAQIPVEDAMKIIAEKGFSAVPAPTPPPKKESGKKK
jgi:hypothetical protein